MRECEILGGIPLIGKVKISGAKNAALKLIVASMLINDEVILENVPKISDVLVLLEIQEKLGIKHEWIENNTLKINSKGLDNFTLSREQCSKTRTPILFAGPLLHRFKEAIIYNMGGCEIGERKIDFHLNNFIKMGVYIDDSNIDFIRLKCTTLRGCICELPFPSVGATENMIISSVLSKGNTVIKNAALEPEIINLISFLQAAGAIIFVKSNREIHIEGVTVLKKTRFKIIPDRIEAASYGIAAILTRGDITVENVSQGDMLTFLSIMNKMNAGIEINKDSIRFFYKGNLNPVNIETDVHPGCMTDWQPLLTLLLTQTSGISTMHETVYENRLGYINTLNSLGAKIQLSTECIGGSQCRFKDSNYNHSAIIYGGSELKAGKFVLPDLRAGFTYVLLALAANGCSSLTGIDKIERGYENVIEKFQKIGARIKLRTIKSELEVQKIIN